MSKRKLPQIQKSNFYEIVNQAIKEGRHVDQLKEMLEDYKKYPGMGFKMLYLKERKETHMGSAIENGIKEMIEILAGKKSSSFNAAEEAIKDLEIIDLVPPIANIERSLELGTMKPKEIRHTKQGTKVIWSLPEFEVQEHRLITYNIRAKLNILGSFKLPRAEAHYGKRSGKKGKAYSNFLTLE